MAPLPYMAKTQRMDEESLKQLIDTELRQAYGYGDGKLEQERRRNEYFFLGEAKEELAPPEIDGRSRVVDTTVRNTVLGMEPALMKTFYGSDNVFEFEETRPGEESKAKMASVLVNHIFRKQNPGYTIAATWIREALLVKKGFLKVWWDPTNVESKEEYRGQTIEQMVLLMEDPEIEVIESKDYPDEDAEKQKAKMLEQMGQQLAQIQQAAQTPGPQQQQAMQALQGAAQQYQQAQAQPVPMLYDVVCKRTVTGGRVCIENVPPDEYRVSKKAKNVQTAPFQSHVVRRRVFELEQAGYKLPDQLPGDDSSQFSAERIERLQFIDDDAYQNGDGESIDPSQREVVVTESYLQVDMDNDGIPEWRKVVKCGDLILSNEEVDGPAFVALGSIPMPHQLFDLCPADLAIEPQRIGTSLKRAQLDNMYLAVNGRNWVLEDAVNLDDLLNSTPGGAVRVKQRDAVGRLDQGIGDMAGAMALTQYFQAESDESTGFSRQTQGGNGMALQETATAANIITNRADARVEVIARYMAETGFTELGNKILSLVTKYQKKAEMIKIAGEFVAIDPREWTNKFDLTINVGLGTGNKDQLVQHLMLLNQQQMNGLQIGTATPQNIHALGMKLANALGFKNGDAFFNDPAKNPPPQQPNPDQMKIQAQQQQFQAKMQADQQTAQMQAQFDVQKAQMQAQAQIQVDMAREQAAVQQHGMKLQHEAELAAMKEQMAAQSRAEDLAFQQYKFDRQLEADSYEKERDRDSKIVLAQISADQKADAALQAAEQQSNEDMANGPE